VEKLSAEHVLAFGSRPARCDHRFSVQKLLTRRALARGGVAKSKLLVNLIQTLLND